jgi:hypothetical protein
MVRKYRIIGTNMVVFDAYERQDETTHATTITFWDGEKWGRIGTDPDVSKFKHITAGEKRSQAVQDAYGAEYLRAYQDILEIFPEAEAGQYYMGEITVEVNDERS